MADEEIGVVLSLKQKQAMLSGLREVQTALKQTGTDADTSSQKAPIAASRWKSFQDRLGGVQGSLRQTGRASGAMFGVLVSNSQGALGPIGLVYDKIAGVGTIMEQTQSKAGKFAIGFGAAMTGVGVVLGTIVSKEQAGQNALNAAIDAAGGHHEDYRKQIEHNINIGHKYGDTAARTTTALNRLVLATRNPQEAFKLYNSVLQISAARHMDVEQVALLVGRALHGQARSLQAFGFQLNTTQKQQVALTGITKAHKSAVGEVAKAQQNLVDVQARLGESHKKTGNSALSVASGHLAVESATIAYNKAVYQHGANSVQAQMASQRLQISQGRLNATMAKGNTVTGLTISQQITLRNAQQRLSDAQTKAATTGAALALTQKDVAKQGDTADQIVQQTSKYLAGQGAANINTFTGHLHALAATLDDEVAAGGSHVYKFLTIAGPAMMGLGAIIESGFIPKLGRLFLKVTGVQRALDLFSASEQLAGTSAVLAGEEVDASATQMSTGGVSKMAKFQGAVTGVALAVGAYEVGTRVHGAAGAVGGGLMGALAGMTIGFSVGGPWGAAIGGAIGLIGGLAAHMDAAASATDAANKATQNWMTTAYQADQFQMGAQFRQGVLNDLQKNPDAASALATAGVNIGQITAGIASGNAVGGPAGKQLQAARVAGRISQQQYNTALNALQTLVANFGSVATNLDDIATITGVTSDHMKTVAAGAASLAATVYAMPVAGSSATYTPPSLTGLLTPPGTISSPTTPPSLFGLLTPPVGAPHALGGPVQRGVAYPVGEGGVEHFVAPADGYIIPHGGLDGGEPTVVQIVIDRKVVGEAMIGYVQDKAARR